MGMRSTAAMDLYDITIIGAGPTGLFAGFYAGLREMRTKIIDALPEVGGQLTTLYPEKIIFDSPGYPQILAKDLVKQLFEQTNGVNPTLVLGERATSIKHLEGNVIKILTDKRVHYTRTLLISAGVGAFQPNKLPIPALEKYDGNGVYYHVKDKESFKGKRLLIVGGGDSAVDWALNLMDVCSKITLVHRRDQFRAHEASVKELLASPVDVKLFYELKDIRGNAVPEEAVIFNNKTNEVSTLPVDAVLLNLGFKADLGPIKDWGLELDGRSIVVNANMETNLPGVYAGGDVITIKGAIKLNLIAIGFAHAATAVAAAKKRLDPTAPTFTHSSEGGLPTSKPVAPSTPPAY